jgi:hypothetical protein
MRPHRFFLLGLACTALVSSAREIVLTDPAYGKINSSALDQPRLHALVSDPVQSDAFITWFNPATELTEFVLLTVFVDTGASGFAISHLNATGELDQPNLGFDTSDYFGTFTETGIGGTEPGNVSRRFGIWVRNGAPGASEEILPSEFIPYGDFNLWVRRDTGAGEVIDFGGFPLVDPLNLVGMPVIRQRRLSLDPTAMAGLGALETALLAPGAPEPETQATVTLALRDFIGTTPPPGEILPSHYANPVIPGITLTHDGRTATGEWLLDTGAGSSFTSFAMAKAAGLIPADYATLADFMLDYTGPTADIGGIGSALTVPRLNVQRLTVTTREGATLVWQNVDLLVADVAGLQGIFGMNLLVPAITLDLADPLGSLFDSSPGAFTRIIIDTTNAADPVMRLAIPYAAGTVFAWLGHHFDAAERLQPTVGTLIADPDHDGLPNLLEYALGLDPRSPAPTSALPVAQRLEINGQPFLALSIERPAGGLPDLVYTPEISNDLVTWRRDSGEIITSAPVPNGARETLTYRTAQPAAPGSRVFLRLSVQLVP